LQGIEKVTKEEFLNNSNATAAFKSTVATNLDVDEEAVVITNITDSTGERRLLRMMDSSERRLSTPVLLIDYSVIVVIQSLGYQNASDAAAFIITSLQESISSGNFSATLTEKSTTLGVVLLNNVTANTITVKEFKVTYNSASPTSIPTSAPSISYAPTAAPTRLPGSQGSGSGSDNVIIIVVIVVVLIGVIGLVATFVWERRKSAKVVSVEKYNN